MILESDFEDKVNRLHQLGIIDEIYNVSDFFFDEPKYYSYTCFTKITSSKERAFKKKGLFYSKNHPLSGGSSFLSMKIALTKAVNESVERFCQSTFPKRKVIFTSYRDLILSNKRALNPRLFINSQEVESRIFGWIKGYYYIPAQLAYLTYLNYYKEPLLTPVITTGAASSFSRERSRLTGIYEVVERDATMTMWLANISFPSVEFSAYSKIQEIISRIERYNIKAFVINITNDLLIPVYLAILVDKTGLGPAVAVGSKASLSHEEAVIGSLEEALMCRLIIRRHMINQKTNDFNIKLSDITSSYKIGLFWANPGILHELDFLLKGNSVRFQNNNKDKANIKNSLNKCLALLDKKKHKPYFIDLTPPELEKLDFYIIKTIIPGLQPLYLDQTQRVINYERLKQVSEFFGKKKLSVNQFPHPFP